MDAALRDQPLATRLGLVLMASLVGCGDGGPRASVRASVSVAKVVRQIAATLDQVCAREQDGAVACSGCLEPPCPDTEYTGIMAVAGISGAIDVVAKRSFGCAVLADRGVRCWENLRGADGRDGGLRRSSRVRAARTPRCGAGVTGWRARRACRDDGSAARSG